MVTLEGSSQPSLFLRVARTIAYVLIGLAGLLLLLSPIFKTGEGFITLAMTWFLLVGGVSSALGTGTSRWFGEFVGLPLLIPSFTVFGIITFRGGFDSAPYIATANLCLLVGIACMFLARWRYVFSVFKVANRFKREEVDGDE